MSDKRFDTTPKQRETRVKEHTRQTPYGTVTVRAHWREKKEGLSGQRSFSATTPNGKVFLNVHPTTLNGSTFKRIDDLVDVTVSVLEEENIEDYNYDMWQSRTFEGLLQTQITFDGYQKLSERQRLRIQQKFEKAGFKKVRIGRPQHAQDCWLISAERVVPYNAPAYDRAFGWRGGEPLEGRTNNW